MSQSIPANTTLLSSENGALPELRAPASAREVAMRLGRPRMKIGELATKTGKTVRALHLYEELGLLRPARTDGGFRLYGPDELARVYWIGKLQDMGFKLQQIQGLLEAVEQSNRAPEAMAEIRDTFRSKLEATREQLRRLTQLERDLADSLTYLEACRGCTETAPASAACGTCVADRHTVPQPNLVAGFHLRGEREAAEFARGESVGTHAAAAE